MRRGILAVAATLLVAGCGGVAQHTSGTAISVSRSCSAHWGNVSAVVTGNTFQSVCDRWVSDGASRGPATVAKADYCTPIVHAGLTIAVKETDSSNADSATLTFQDASDLCSALAWWATGCGSIPDLNSNGGNCSPPSLTPLPAVPTATLAPTPVPTPPPPPSYYPPTSVADLHALAATGNASAIHEFHSESVGLATCPIPKREVTVDPTITGQQLAADLMAYWYGQGLENPCGAVVFAYHSQDEAGNAYTAGRVNLDVYDSSGGINIDPNASNLKYTLTLDAGQESVVNY